MCVMPNHVHLVLVPPEPGALTAALAPAHRCYAWVVNRRNGWQGHLWQNRFFSCPLDGEHLVKVVRYVELNPVRARLVESPEQWAWSSTRAHLAGRPDKLIRGELPAGLKEIGDWSAFLAAGLAEDDARLIRDHQSTETPLGNAAFVGQIEQLTGRNLHRRPRGRPRSDEPRVGEPRRDEVEALL